jgi:hypothetical protein
MFPDTVSPGVAGDGGGEGEDVDSEHLVAS